MRLLHLIPGEERETRISKRGKKIEIKEEEKEENKSEKWPGSTRKGGVSVSRVMFMLRPMKVGDETCIIHHINKVGKKRRRNGGERCVDVFGLVSCRESSRAWPDGGGLVKKKSRDCTRPSAQSRHLPGFLYSN